MPTTTTSHDHKTRIARVLDYLFTHSSEAHSLETLAGVAHYSPFHLQKIFKEQVGETPKQYSLQLKLEIAYHYLLIDPAKPVHDIALENGFSSLSVFSRAIKTQFGHSPEQIRNLPHNEQMRLLHGKSPNARPNLQKPQPKEAEITIVRRPTIQGIYLLAPFNDEKKIQQSFENLTRINSNPENLYGILTPHQRNTYRAFLAMPAGSNPETPTHEIQGGVFATFLVSGNLRQVNKTAHYFYRRWLPANGYKIAGIAGFETFDQNPATTPYTQLQRRIHIPIAPKS